MGLQVETTINLANAADAKAAVGKITGDSLNTAFAAAGLPKATLTSAPQAVLSGAPRTSNAWALTSILLGLTVVYSLVSKEM